MVANESEALRWVTRQWERRIATDVILNVYGMLWEWYVSWWAYFQSCGLEAEAPSAQWCLCIVLCCPVWQPVSSGCVLQRFN